ncbi:MAG: hypothetical protein ACFE9L_18460 [Candidatus Hodarchaeota archaeon]
MGAGIKSHEDIIKFIYLLDKWRRHYPTEKEIIALSTGGSERFPIEVKKSTKIARSLKIPPNFPLLDRYISQIQTLAVALTVVFVFVLLSSFWNLFSWTENLLSNPLFVFSILIFLIITAFIMYQHRIKTNEYLLDNKDQLKEFKLIANDLISQLVPLALKRDFKPKEYPFQLSYDDYQGLRLIGRRGSTFHFMFSTPHSLMSSSNKVKIMTSYGRLSFYDGLKGFQGGKPAIKLIVSQIAGDLKSYLKRCANWRQMGVDVLVRKAEEGQIERTYLILDDQDIWVTDQLLEELDISDSVKLTKITNNSDRNRIVENFDKLWEMAQAADELEALSWRTYFKERAEEKRKRLKELE